MAFDKSLAELQSGTTALPTGPPNTGSKMLRSYTSKQTLFVDISKDVRCVEESKTVNIAAQEDRSDGQLGPEISSMTKRNGRGGGGGGAARSWLGISTKLHYNKK